MIVHFETLQTALCSRFVVSVECALRCTAVLYGDAAGIIKRAGWDPEKDDASTVAQKLENTAAGLELIGEEW